MSHPHALDARPAALYQQIVESAVDYAIVTFDAHASVTSWNEGAHHVLGWTREEMLGQSAQRFFTPEDVAAGVLETEMAKARDEGRSLDERFHLRKNGERFWSSGEVMPLRGPQGEEAGFVTILRDHSQQHRMQADLENLNDTLRASEDRLLLALSLGGMGAWEVNLRTSAMQWWPGMHALHGLPPEAEPITLEQYVNVLHPDDRQRVTDAAREAIARTGDLAAEYRIRLPDGSFRWLELRGKCSKGPDGKALTLTGACMEVTRRKNVEQDLKFLVQTSAALAELGDYQATLDRIAQLAVPSMADWCAIDMLQDDGSLQRVSIARVDALHGYDRGFSPDPEQPGGIWEVVRSGQPQLLTELTDDKLYREIRNPEHREALRALGMRCFMSVPLNVRGKTLGAITLVSVEMGRRYGSDELNLADGLARRAAVAIENARMYQFARESDRAKDVFLAMLAHELRNPLAPIWNALSIIKLAPNDKARVNQFGGVIERQVRQLSHLVDDLLDVSRIATGKIELKREHTNLLAIVNSAVEISRPHIEAAHHHLSINFPEESTHVYADPARMAQVLSNLLNNAAKYTRPGGHIEVLVEVKPQWLVVRVRDNGIGIREDMIKNVFALFAQAKLPQERRQGGLGIGLSLVDGLVRLHGGTVEARSEGPDRGSEFIVSLPRTPVGNEDIVKEQDGPMAPAPNQHRRRILVVDDNPDAASTVAELLEMFGHEVAAAHDGTSAVEAMTQFRPDVVLLDIGLPDISGYEVARRIRGLHGVRQPTLIALTGWGQQQDKRLAAEAGFDQHWTKPVDPSRLRELSAR